MFNRSSDTQAEDHILIDQVLAGDKIALESLVKKHQHWIFNTALNMVADPEDAADITQEVLIKVITNLRSFKGESQFRTWVYRIIKNHFLNEKRSQYTKATLSFDDYANGLNSIPDESLDDFSLEVDKSLLVEEAKISCMKGMLLCLTPEQRLIFILGELFEFSDSVGSQVMDISKANFRAKLHRARAQLYNFMKNKCGLINKENPCRCAKKTVGFIKKGYVDPVHLHFQKETLATIEKVAEHKTEVYQEEVETEYRKLYQRHPYLKGPESLQSIRELLSSNQIKETFDLQ